MSLPDKSNECKKQFCATTAATTAAPVEEEKVHGGKAVAHTAGRKGRMVHHVSSHTPKQEDFIDTAHYGDGGEGGDGGAVAMNVAALDADPEWQSYLDKDTQRWYYVHNVTSETQWAVS